VNYIFPVKNIHSLKPHRKPGYVEACLKTGKVTGNEIEFTGEQMAQLRKQFHHRHRLRGLGDLIHFFALPIARLLRLRCFDKLTRRLKPASPCAMRRRAANNLSLATFYKIRKFLHL